MYDRTIEQTSRRADSAFSVSLYSSSVYAYSSTLGSDFVLYATISAVSFVVGWISILSKFAVPCYMTRRFRERISTVVRNFCTYRVSRSNRSTQISCGSSIRYWKERVERNLLRLVGDVLRRSRNYKTQEIGPITQQIQNSRATGESTRFE